MSEIGIIKTLTLRINYYQFFTFEESQLLDIKISFRIYYP